MSNTQFSRHTENFWTGLIADLLPTGCVWAAKQVQSSNLYKLLENLQAKELRRIEDKIVRFIEQYDPATTNDFLTEWERVLQIPDDCIPLATTNAERQANIVLKMNLINIVTQQDYIRIADILGFTVTITPLIDIVTGFAYTFAFAFGSPRGAMYIWEVSGTYNAQLQCIFEKLKPAHTGIVWN